MLVLTRKINESFMIGEDICVTLTQINKTQVKIGIDAPKNISIMRKELLDGTTSTYTKRDNDSLGESDIDD